MNIFTLISSWEYKYLAANTTNSNVVTWQFYWHNVCVKTLLLMVPLILINSYDPGLLVWKSFILAKCLGITSIL